MLAPRDQQQSRLFTLDRKLGSTLPSELHEALDDLESLLPSLTRVELVNSITMRMLQLLPTSRSFQLKQRIARLLNRIAPTVYTLPSRDHITGLIGKCIKASDAFTRITSLQMLRSVSGLFVQDIALYHTLLAKLNPDQDICTSERKECVLCLGVLLTHSPTLSRLFSRAFPTIIQVHKIPQRFILYLLVQAQIQPRLQTTVVDQIVTILNSNSGNAKKKRELHYLSRLVVKLAGNNYMIVQLYHQRLFDLLPHINKPIQQLQMTLYPFLKLPPNRSLVLVPTTQQLLDTLYRHKKDHSSITQQDNQIIQERFEQQLDKNNLSECILLLYYVQTPLSRFDQAITQRLSPQHIKGKNIKRLLKQMLAVGLIEAPIRLIEFAQLTTNQYIVLKSYLLFKQLDNLQSLQQLHEVVGIVAPSLQILTNIWLSQSRSSETQSNPSIFKQLQRTACLEEIHQITTQFSSQGGEKLKEECSHLVPSGCLHQVFWYAHLPKSVIRTLCS